MTLSLLSVPRSLLFGLLISWQTLGYASLRQDPIGIAVLPFSEANEPLSKVFPLLERKLNHWILSLDQPSITLNKNRGVSTLSPAESQEFRKEIAQKDRIKALAKLEALYFNRQIETFKAEFETFDKTHVQLSLEGKEEQKVLFLKTAFLLLEGKKRAAKEVFEKALLLNPTYELPYDLDWENESSSPELVHVGPWRAEVLAKRKPQSKVEFKIEPVDARLFINGFEIAPRDSNLVLLGSNSYSIEVSHPQFQTKKFSIKTNSAGKQTFSIKLNQERKFAPTKASIFVDTNGKEINFYLFHPDKGIQTASMNSRLALQDLVDQPLQTSLNLNEKSFIDFFKSQDLDSKTLAAAPQLLPTSLTHTLPSPDAWYQDWRWWGALGVVSGIVLITVISRSSHEDPVKMGQINLHF